MEWSNKNRSWKKVFRNKKNCRHVFIFHMFELQWATNVLRHLVVKLYFWAFWSHFSPFTPKQSRFFYFFDYIDHSPYTTLNWEAGGIRELKLEANKIEQMLKVHLNPNYFFLLNKSLHLFEMHFAFLNLILTFL